MSFEDTINPKSLKGREIEKEVVLCLSLIKFTFSKIGVKGLLIIFF